MNPLGVAGWRVRTKIGAGMGTGEPIMHEIHSIATVLGKLDEMGG